jgi:hypothetical protein
MFYNPSGRHSRRLTVQQDNNPRIGQCICFSANPMPCVATEGFFQIATLREFARNCAVPTGPPPMCIGARAVPGPYEGSFDCDVWGVACRLY